MGMCAHDPIPISAMNRFLGKDLRTLTSVTECPLLLKIPEHSLPTDVYDQIPRIYTHFSTLTQFRERISKYLIVHCYVIGPSQHLYMRHACIPSDGNDVGKANHTPLAACLQIINCQIAIP